MEGLGGIGKLYASGNTLSMNGESLKGENGEQRLRARTRAVVREPGRRRAFPGPVRGRRLRARGTRIPRWGHRANPSRNLARNGPGAHPGARGLVRIPGG